MSRNLSPEFLRRLRNEIPIDWLIKHLGWPNKRRDGQFFCFFMSLLSGIGIGHQAGDESGSMFPLPDEFQSDRLHDRRTPDGLSASRGILNSTAVEIADFLQPIRTATAVHFYALMCASATRPFMRGVRQSERFQPKYFERQERRRTMLGCAILGHLARRSF